MTNQMLSFKSKALGTMLWWPLFWLLAAVLFGALLSSSVRGEKRSKMNRRKLVRTITPNKQSHA
jgi:hypothetical protein